MFLYSWHLQAITLASFSVSGVSASERVTSYRSRLFRHPDHAHEHHEANHDVNDVRHFLHDGQHGGTLPRPRPVAHLDRSRSIAEEFDMDMRSFTPLNLDNHPVFGRVGLMPHSVDRSNGMADAHYTDLDNGMSALFQIQDPGLRQGTTSLFVMGDRGATQCPRGSTPIPDVDRCRAAATYFEKTFDGADSKTDRPAGCYVAGVAGLCGTGLNLNQDETGGANPSARPVCEVALDEAPGPVAASASPQEISAPAAPQPGYQGRGCQCPCSGAVGCNCGCGGGLSLTTLIPVPLVPQPPWQVPSTTAAIYTAPAEAAAAAAVTETTAAPVAPMTTPVPEVASQAATNNATAPAAAPDAAVEVTTAAPMTTAAPPETTPPAEYAAATAAPVATDATSAPGTETTTASGSFLEEPALIMEGAPVPNLNSWQGASHRPSSLLGKMFGD